MSKNKNKKIIRFVESLVILPLATMSTPLGPIPNSIDLTQSPQAVFIQKENIETLGLMAFNQAMDAKEEQRLIDEARAEAIDEYFTGLPLEGHGAGMIEASNMYDLDWRLIPAIAMRETTGGKFACPKTVKRTGDIRYSYNVFGWGSCKITFNSYEDAFETLARNLSGNNPNTAYHYAGKDVEEILKAYNPPSIVPKYAPQVMKIMNDIGSKNLGSESLAQA